MSSRGGPGDALLRRLRALRTWKRGGERAPHKPLLLLLALGRLEHKLPRLARFEELEKPLQQLLKDFGRPSGRTEAQLPFWHLQNDELWVVTDAHQIPLRPTGNSPSRRDLIAHDAEGGFTAEAFEALRSQPALRRQVARLLLEQHFPPSMHEEILEEAGLDLVVTALRTARDPEFRIRVLRAYSRSCAVCGFDAHLSSGSFGIDAAHVKWKQADGPDVVENGLCLCVLHHRAFDRGVFTIDDRRHVLVSADLAGHVGPAEHFWSFHDRPIRDPQPGCSPPADEFLVWHRSEVFRAPGRGRRDAG